MGTCECNCLFFLSERDLRDTVNSLSQFGCDPSIRPVKGPPISLIHHLAFSLLFTDVVLVHRCHWLLPWVLDQSRYSERRRWGEGQSWQWKLVLFFTDTVTDDDRLSTGCWGGHQEAQNTNKPWILIWFSRCSFSPCGRAAVPTPQVTTTILL